MISLFSLLPSPLRLVITLVAWSLLPPLAFATPPENTTKEPTPAKTKEEEAKAKEEDDKAKANADDKAKTKEEEDKEEEEPPPDTTPLLSALRLLPKPAPLSQAAKEKLQKKIKALLSQRKLKKTDLGVFIVDTQGETIFAHNAEKLLIPASNTKIFSMLSILKHLGPHYRFRTKIYADSPINASGTIEGNIYIQGSGDPSLRSEELWRISQNLYNLGLRRITGRIVFDESFFDNKYFGEGWKDHDHHRYYAYMAGISALSLNYNSVTIMIHPAQQAGGKAYITIDPESRYFHGITNRVVTVEGKKPRRIRVTMQPSKMRDRIVVRGEIAVGAPSKRLRRRVSYPGWYTAYSLATFLQRARIKVSPWPLERSIPKRAVKLLKHTSPPLSVILQAVGKHSSNFTTEQLIKVLGAKVHKEPGTWEKGLKVVEDDLKALGIPPKSYVMKNGSGLGRGNRFTPQQASIVLRSLLADLRLWSEYFVAQPIAGRDGTLSHRMKESDVRERIRAKTGTLDGVSALSGYAFTQDRRLWMFSMLMNGKLRHNKLFRKIQNKIGVLMTNFREP